MSEVNWDLAPEGATMIISSDKELRWANEDGQWWFDKVDGWKFLTGNPLKLSCWKAIATRPTQKTVEDAVEQDGEKWTHTYSDYGVRKDCILIHDKPDIHGQVLIMNRYGEYVLTGTAELKPIKPKLTKSQAWDTLEAKYIYEGGDIDKAYRFITEDYDII